MTTQEQRAGRDALYSVGHWLLNQSRERDAADLFRVFAMVAPNDERAWRGLAECHARLGQLEVALQMAGTGTVLSSDKVRLHLQRARLLIELDRTEDAGEARALAREAADGAEELEMLVRREESR